MLVKRRLWTFVAGLAFAAATPAVADAATLTNAGGTLTFQGNGDTVNRIAFQQEPAPSNTVRVIRNIAFAFGDDNDPITATGCTDDGTGYLFVCPDVAALVVDTAGLDDTVDAVAFRGVMTINGGAGDDSLSGFGGLAASTLNGGEGDDLLQLVVFDHAAVGVAHVVSGGSGVDSASFVVGLSDFGPTPASAALDVSVSPDGVANDGVAGQGANVAADIEDVAASSSFTDSGTGLVTFGKVTVSGSAAANSVRGGGGNDTLDGLAGNDSLYARGGDDTVNARDGYADRVSCGDGNDTAHVDTLDEVSPSCENVQTAAVGNANEDKAPTIAWAAPAANAMLPANTPTTLHVNAADDNGVTQVQFFDDDRVVCTDTVAPYTCSYQARGDDVGRDTLLAVASDAVGQTASSVRTVTVDRFAVSTVSLTLKPAKDKSAPWKFTASGQLTLPSTVSTSACADGVVAVVAKAGSRTISTRTASLSKTCSYSVTVTFTNKKRFPSNGKLKFQASFRGTIALQAKRSSTKTASTK
jgi:Ca2+-binding RTX toxin-like protein